MNRRPVEYALARLLDRIAANPVRWALGFFMAGYVGGGVIFSLIEKDASVFDGLWWAYISMFTVGYGDFSPKTWIVRTLAYAVVAFGWSALLIIGAALAGRIAERRVLKAKETPELDDDIDGIIGDLEALKSVLKHPKVVDALREVHEQQRSDGL